MKGVHHWQLPAGPDGPTPSATAQGGFSFDHGFGHFTYTTTANGLRGQRTNAVWFVDTSPSIALNDPYPDTTLDWRPTLGSPRP
jgi:hypothetical protein